MIDKDITYSSYDAARYLCDEQDIEAYLAAVLEDGTPSMIVVALGNIARARNISQLAKDTKMSRSRVCKALSGHGSPRFSTIMKLANALGYRISFKKA
ncbi:putative addiction module antidote protein [Aeromonas sp. CA23]|uniref:addiction module antidote protein n=1 Tax=Aeromonas sp. CA23 TaxID=2033032 RepID=UPI000BFE5105|nr:addiction module antidote protein [Aeromonas sp. CA23]ATL98243.1 putative addiction module antidote protein [Aeromonas sp. CA23]